MAAINQDIFHGLGPWDAPEFPPVHTSSDHVVLYVTSSGPCNVPPKPWPGQDLWDQEHVRMPHSAKSLHDVPANLGFSLNKKIRWEVIEKALKKKIKNSQDLAKAILSYNTKFENEWTFAAMHKFFDKIPKDESDAFFKDTLPLMVQLALDLPNLVLAAIPLLKKDTNMSISLSQLQIASLLANAFFCTYPRRNTTHAGSQFGNYPRINFSSLYETAYADVVREKLRCIIHYFNRVCRTPPKGVVTFSRRSVYQKDLPNWEESDIFMDSAPFCTDTKHTIADAHGSIHVEFVNKLLGGGILGADCDHEEVRFLAWPEMMVSMLFTEKLKPNEAVMAIGCERYCNSLVYGCRKFQFSGDYQDITPMDSSGRKRCAVVAVDAASHIGPSDQYQMAIIIRELNKTWNGFSFYMHPKSPMLEYPGVATGKWGCVAGNSAQLHALIQLMASVQARRPIAYFTCGDTVLQSELFDIYLVLGQHAVTVGQLFKLLEEYCRTDHTIYLYAYLEMKLTKIASTPKPVAFTNQNETASELEESEQWLELDEATEEQLIDNSSDENSTPSLTPDQTFASGQKVPGGFNLYDKPVIPALPISYAPRNNSSLNMSTQNTEESFVNNFPSFTQTNPLPSNINNSTNDLTNSEVTNNVSPTVATSAITTKPAANVQQSVLATSQQPSLGPVYTNQEQIQPPVVAPRRIIRNVRFADEPTSPQTDEEERLQPVVPSRRNLPELPSTSSVADAIRAINLQCNQNPAVVGNLTRLPKPLVPKKPNWNK